MEFGQAVELGRDALWMAMFAAAPILLIGLVVGLVIALLQAVTQLQEQTLTFVPKIAAMMIAAAVFIPWISEQMLEYTRDLLSSLPWTP
jgi:flagellar biosynthetic protein FliQ